jgi:hypothetical protein
MGSIAMDQAGDMAVGYSVSSSSVNPSVRYAGRVATDPAGTLEAEVNVISGTGSQNGGLTRWGDYSAMTVDPLDDCTFWYTQEYMKATGSFNWNTRIANFKFANCGGGSAPAVSLSTAKLTFPKTVIGRTSIAKSVTLTNTGNATLDISSVKVTGDFAISANTCGTQVAAAASCKVSLTFTPTATGTRTGALSFNDDAPGSPQTVALVGTGTQITFSPVSLNFNTIVVGQTSAAKTITVTNVGTTVVTFTSFSIGGANPGDYLITTNTCGASLAGGASCSVGVALKPTAIGTRKATLKVADDGGGSPQTASLTGIGG